MAFYVISGSHLYTGGKVQFLEGGTLAKMHTYHSLQGYPPCKIAFI